MTGDFDQLVNTNYLVGLILNQGSSSRTYTLVQAWLSLRWILYIVFVFVLSIASLSILAVAVRLYRLLVEDSLKLIG